MEASSMSKRVYSEEKKGSKKKNRDREREKWAKLEAIFQSSCFFFFFFFSLVPCLAPSLLRGSGDRDCVW